MVNKTKVLVFLLLLMISIGLVACSNGESTELDWQPLFRQIHSEQEYIF